MRARNQYDRLASEYYDPVRHPTCANFASASYLCTVAWLRSHPFRGTAVDVGCGDSLLARVVRELDLTADALILVDSSSEMLAHSQSWVDVRTRLLLADAGELPLPDASVAFLLASLGDPYNTPPFWSEVARVLAPQGVVLFTAPSWEWASQFRPVEGSPADVAVFELASGETLLTPSYIRPVNEQTTLVKSVGLSVLETGVVTVVELGATVRLSPKLESLHERGALVEWLTARRSPDLEAR